MQRNRFRIAWIILALLFASLPLRAAAELRPTSPGKEEPPVPPLAMQVGPLYVRELLREPAYTVREPGGVAWDGERYLYVSGDGQFYESADGIDWRQAQIEVPYGTPQPNRVRQLHWAGGQFILLTDLRYYTSTDGRQWQMGQIKHPDFKKEYELQEIIYIDGAYIALALERPNLERLYREAQGGPVIYSYGPNTFFQSTDLVRWTPATTTEMAQSLLGERPLHHLATNGQNALAGGNAGARSTDGGTRWTGWQGGVTDELIWDGTRFLMVLNHGSGQRIQASPDGETWQVLFEGQKHGGLQLDQIGSTGRDLLLMGRDSSNTPGTHFLYSTDGANWEWVALTDTQLTVTKILSTPHAYIAMAKAGQVQRFLLISPYPEKEVSPALAQAVAEAEARGLIPTTLQRFYQGPLTQGDLEALAARLYTRLTGNELAAPTAPRNPNQAASRPEVVLRLEGVLTAAKAVLTAEQRTVLYRYLDAETNEVTREQGYALFGAAFAQAQR